MENRFSDLMKAAGVVGAGGAGFPTHIKLSEHYVIRKKGLSKKQILNQSKLACIQCVRCTDLCPRNLLGHNMKPHLVMRIANYGLKDFEGMKTALGCSECGACELFACPGSLSPKSMNVMVKRLIQRLDLKKYDVEAPLSQSEYKPDVVVIPLKQHVSAPAAAIVREGDLVEEGALIAGVEDGKLGANIHASIHPMPVLREHYYNEAEMSPAPI